VYDQCVDRCLINYNNNLFFVVEFLISTVSHRGRKPESIYHGLTSTSVMYEELSCVEDAMRLPGYHNEFFQAFLDYLAIRNPDINSMVGHKQGCARTAILMDGTDGGEKSSTGKFRAPPIHPFFIAHPLKEPCLPIDRTFLSQEDCNGQVRSLVQQYALHGLNSVDYNLMNHCISHPSQPNNMHLLLFLVQHQHSIVPHGKPSLKQAKDNTGQLLLAILTHYPIISFLRYKSWAAILRFLLMEPDLTLESDVFGELLSSTYLICPVLQDAKADGLLNLEFLNAFRTLLTVLLALAKAPIVPLVLPTGVSLEYKKEDYDPEVVTFAPNGDLIHNSCTDYLKTGVWLPEHPLCRFNVKFHLDNAYEKICAKKEESIHKHSDRKKGDRRVWFVILCLDCNSILGFATLRGDESLKEIMEMILTRWPVPPLISVFDNNENNSLYSITRLGDHFKHTDFFVDKFHYNGHKRSVSSPAYDPKLRDSLLSHYNTSLAEETNASMEDLLEQTQKMSFSRSFAVVRDFVARLNTHDLIYTTKPKK
jgi:hypothetical protein